MLGKLGRIKQAEGYINELLQIKPESPKRPKDKDCIRLLFVLDKHVESIWDGLYKAGMRNWSRMPGSSQLGFSDLRM